MPKRKHVAAAIIPLLFFSFLLFGFLDPFVNSFVNEESSSSSSGEKRAAIIDQLSAATPNETFVGEATDLLEVAGYDVDYYPQEEVTVDFYGNLTSYGYDIIIFRVHSSMSEYGDNPVVLFTSEEYSQDKYSYQQLSDTVKKVYFSYEEEQYFGVSPKFVKGLDGSFDDTSIILMGCEGLKRTNMADAFLIKEAKVVVGWNGPVTIDHTDVTTLTFLEHYVKDTMTVLRAMDLTVRKMGDDPSYNASLKYYPEPAASKRVYN